MTPSPLVRLAGPSAVLAGVLICVAQVGMLLTLDTNDRGASLSIPLFVASMATYFVGLGVLLLTLVATYEAQAHPMAGSIAIAAGGAIGFLALSAPFGIPLGLAVGALGAWITWRSPSAVAAVPRPAAPGELGGMEATVPTSAPTTSANG